MTGSVHLRGKKWSAVLNLGIVDGKRKQRWVKLDVDPTLTKTKQEAEATRQLYALLERHDKGTYVEPSKVTLGTYVESWLEVTVKPHKRPRTYGLYASLFGKHVAKAPIASIPLQKLRGSDVEKFYADLFAPADAKAKGLKASSIGVIHAMLHRALRKAVKDKLLTTNPAFDLDDRPKKEKGSAVTAAKLHCWSAVEARRVIDAAKRASVQLGTYVLLALDCGARKSELDGLTWADVDFERGELTVARQLDKAGEKPEWGPTKNATSRTVSLGAETLAQLKVHKRHQAELKMKNRGAYQDFGLVFAKEDIDLVLPQARLGQPIVTLSGPRFQALVKAAGVKRIKFHGVRHTVATLSLEAGAKPHVVAAKLGHDVMMLMKVYAHATPEAQQDAAAKLANVLHG